MLPIHPSQISEFCLGLGGDTKVFYPPPPDDRGFLIFALIFALFPTFKISSFTSPGHMSAMSVPPRSPFLSAELWVIRYHLGNLGIIMHNRVS